MIMNMNMNMMMILIQSMVYQVLLQGLASSYNRRSILYQIKSNDNEYEYEYEYDDALTSR